MQYIKFELLHETFFIVEYVSLLYVHSISPVVFRRGQNLHLVLLQRLKPGCCFLTKVCFLLMVFDKSGSEQLDLILLVASLSKFDV